MDAKKQFSRIGWAYVIFLVTAYVATELFFIVVQLAGLWFIDTANMGVYMLLSQLAMYGCGFPVFFMLMRRIPSWTKVQPERMPVGRFVLSLLFCFGFSYIGSIMGLLLSAFVKLVTGYDMVNPVQDLISDIQPWMLAVSTVLVAPFMEELMFRKMLIDRIIPFGQKTAVLVSGISFGLFHGNFSQFFYACLLGIIFAYIYSSTGKIRYSIILHMCINFVGGMVPSWLLNVEEKLIAWAGSLWLSIWMLGCIITAIVLACIYKKDFSFYSGWEGIETGIVKKILTAPGVIGFLILCLIMFIISIL